MKKNFYTRLARASNAWESIANLNPYNLNRIYHTTFVPQLFLMAHHLWVPCCVLSPTKPEVSQTRLDTMRYERNGCYSISNNPNGISNQIKSIQNWNALILNISPTCLNWKKMEALLTVVWFGDICKAPSKFEWKLHGTLWRPTEDECAGLDCYAIWF